MRRTNEPCRLAFCVSRCAGALAWLTLGLTGPCQAGLGADLASVQADRQAWGASARQQPRGLATLHIQTLPEGVTVHQYVDASGAVFAVAWSGPVLPDFARLLGAHHAAYADAARLHRRSISLQGAQLVIESGGMMRAFSGRAYLPGRLPPGLTAQDIR